MATKGTYTRILVDEYDFSGVNNSVEVAVSSEQFDVTAFQDTGNVFLTGVAGGTITQQGYFDGGAVWHADNRLPCLRATRYEWPRNVYLIACQRHHHAKW